MSTSEDPSCRARNGGSKWFDVEPTLIEGAGGVFDVHVNGTQIWSKHDTGRFPEHNEVLSKIKEVAAKA